MEHTPLLSGLDYTALLWATFWALVFSASRLPSKRRWQIKNGETPTPWWVVITETMLGGLVGGVVCAIALPEIWPILRGPGKQAALAIGGAAVGPLLGQWIPQAAAQAVAFFSEKQLGFKIVVRERKEGDSDVESGK